MDEHSFLISSRQGIEFFRQHLQAVVGRDGQSLLPNGRQAPNSGPSAGTGPVAAKADYAAWIDVSQFKAVNQETDSLSNIRG